MPWKKMLAYVTGEVNESLLARIEYLIEEHRVPRNQIEKRRDTKYTQSFASILQATGTEPVTLPPMSPNLNAFTECFVKSIKTECLDKMILFGEKSLRHVINEYLAHYHAERNHQGIDNVIPFPDDRLRNTGVVKKRERLGGLLNYYHHDAA